MSQLIIGFFLGEVTSCEMFRRRGWLDYYLSVKEFNEEVSLQFMSTLKDDFSMVKGLRIEFIKDVVAKVTGLLQEGENWVKDFDLHMARAQFSVHLDPLLDIDKKQGTSKLSFALEFIQLETFIIQYFTCEGCYKYLHALHFKILAHL